MIPHICKIAHNPPDSYGDCLRASVASILDIDNVEDVPHFNDKRHDKTDDDVFEHLKQYCATIGCAPYLTQFNPDASLETVLDHMKKNNPDIYYLLFGACRGDGHVVIGLNDQIVHDTQWIKTTPRLHGPHPGGYWAVMVFVPMVLKAK